MTRYPTGELEISNSEIQTYSDCRRRWWLIYYRGLKPRIERPVGPLSLGSRVHKALEAGDYSHAEGAKLTMAVLAESIEKDRVKAERLGLIEEFEDDALVAYLVVKGFIEWAAEEGLDSGWEIIQHEQLVKAPPIIIHGDHVVLKGKLDQLIRRIEDGSIWLRDWKTTATLKLVMMQFNPQLRTYLALLSLTEPEAVVNGGVFIFLKKNKRTARAKPPFYVEERLFVSTKERESFWISLTSTLMKMVETTQALEEGVDHRAECPPRPTRDCSWRCPFFNVCEMFDDGSNVEKFLEAEYVVGDPYDYYGVDEDDEIQEIQPATTGALFG